MADNRLGMFSPQNALYASPQAPQDNALYYDDTQGMTQQRGGDPLRWAADYIGQNRDLPPSASAPGLAANSTQPQEDSGVMDILRRYGLAE